MTGIPAANSGKVRHPVVKDDPVDLMLGRVYCEPEDLPSGSRGLTREPLSKLLYAIDPRTGSPAQRPKQNGTARLTNAGGIRVTKSLKDPDITSGIALVSTAKESEWPDRVETIDGVRHFQYHGDSRKPGDPTQTDGNKELLRLFEAVAEPAARREQLPVLLAFQNTTGRSFEYEFMGIAIPGSPSLSQEEWVKKCDGTNESGEQYSNYVFMFTLMNCAMVDGLWVRAAFFGLGSLAAPGAPNEYKEWLANGFAGTTRALEASNETMPEMPEKDGIQTLDALIETLRSRLFAGNNAAVNPLDSGPHDKKDFVNADWHETVVSLCKVDPKHNVVVLLGGPGNGKSALAQCLRTEATNDSYMLREESTIGAPRIVTLTHKDGRKIKIVNDASIPAVPGEGEGLFDVLQWVDGEPANRRALLCVNRGALVEEAAQHDRTGNQDAAETIRGLAEVGRGAPTKTKVIEMDKDSTLKKMLGNNNGPWGTVVSGLRMLLEKDDRYKDSVFARNAAELDENLAGFYSMLLEAEERRGLNMTYRDIWSAVGLFLIGSEEARNHESPLEWCKSANTRTQMGLIGYNSLYGYGWTLGSTRSMAAEIVSPVTRALHATDPAAAVEASQCSESALKEVIDELQVSYPFVEDHRHELASRENLAHITAIAYRMRHCRERTEGIGKGSSASAIDPGTGIVHSKLALFGHLDDDYRAGFDVIGRPWIEANANGVSNTLDDVTPTGGALRWGGDCVVTVHADAGFLAAANLCTKDQIGLSADSDGYVHVLKRVARAHSLKPHKATQEGAQTASDSSRNDSKEGDPATASSIYAPQQVPLPEMIIADVLMADGKTFTHNTQGTMDTRNRVFCDKAGGSRNIKSSLTAIGPTDAVWHKAGVKNWSALSAPSRTQGAGAGALPLTPRMALLQRRGKKLPNFGAIAKFIYREGVESLSKRDTSSDIRYKSLVEVTASILSWNSYAHEGLREIEEALRKDGWSVPDVTSAVGTGPLPMPETPCEWFVVSLAALERLAGKIPPIVCAEWLTALYRTAFGMGYLHVHTKAGDAAGNLSPLLPWVSSERPVSERTVLGSLRRLVAGESPGIPRHRYESVSYVLQALSADDHLYFLTKSQGRGSGVLEPGFGWIDMAVTLAAEIVGSHSDGETKGSVQIYYVNEYIRALRVKPPMSELVRLCSRNRLLTAAVPPDADGALMVYVPYNTGTGSEARQ